ncbi:MAG: hypothetical protein ACPG8W_16535 [Candidatus Promineifilaceae bacterium]
MQEVFCRGKILFRPKQTHLIPLFAICIGFLFGIGCTNVPPTPLAKASATTKPSAPTQTPVQASNTPQPTIITPTTTPTLVPSATPVPISPTDIILGDGSLCVYQQNGAFVYTEYLCNSDSDDEMQLKKSASLRFIYYLRPNDPAINLALMGPPRVRARTVSVTTTDGAVCEPQLIQNWTVADSMHYQCEDAQGNKRLVEGDLQVTDNGVWSLDEDDVAQMVLKHAPVALMGDEALDYAVQGLTQASVEETMQLHGFRLNWSANVSTNGNQYITRIYEGAAASFAYQSSTLIVYQLIKGQYRLIDSADLMIDGHVTPFSLAGQTIETWHDLNQDGYVELVLQTATGGNFCCNGIALFQLRDGALINLTQQITFLERDHPNKVRDLDQDGSVELIASDYVFATLGGCNACGFYTDRIYKWDGELFVENSAEFPDHYRSRIRTLRAQIEYGRLFSPHNLIELLLIYDRIDQTEIGWEILTARWRPKTWDEHYGYVYQNLESKFANPNGQSAEEILSLSTDLETVQTRLQNALYLLDWESDTLINGTTYRSQGFSLNRLFTNSNQVLVVSRKVDDRFVIIHSQPYSALMRYKLAGETLSGWQDVNQDGYAELMLYEQSDQLAILQLNGGSVVRFSDRIEHLGTLNRAHDFGEDGTLELMMEASHMPHAEECERCLLTSHLIYRWDGEAYVEVSAEFPNAYQHNIDRLHNSDLTRHPHQLVELLYLYDRLGKPDIGWRFLDLYWQPAWDFSYGDLYNQLAAVYRDE